MFGLCFRRLLLVVACALAQVAMARAPAAEPTTSAASGYEAALADLHAQLGERYGAFDLKPEIDWPAVGAELIPRAAECQTDEAFGLLVLQMVARLEDSHAYVMDGTRKVPDPMDMPQWDPGFYCLEDDRGRAVVYHIEPDSPAAKARLAPGMAIVSVDDEPTSALIAATDARLKKWYGYSSPRLRRHQSFRQFPRRRERGELMTIIAERPDGMQLGFRVKADVGVRYQTRLPVPIPGIVDHAAVQGRILPDGTGYLYLHENNQTMARDIDSVLRRMPQIERLVIDVRGNAGGGFDPATGFQNFDCEAPANGRPQFCGPVAVLTDEFCMSSGEDWVSWFQSSGRARLFGATTAGTSAHKEDYTLLNGYYKVRIPVRPYTAWAGRPIERRGIEPDEPVGYSAADIAAGRDTVLEAARAWLIAPRREDR